MRRAYLLRRAAMPAYEYTCKDCGKEFTMYLSIIQFEAHPKIKCPSCDRGHVIRKFTGFFVKIGRKS